MSILLHSCCGPCLGGTYPMLKEKAGDQRIATFWDNPNIHPYLEYKDRLESFQKMSKEFGLEIFYGDSSYGLDRFMTALAGEFGPKRCSICYELRLNALAKKASENSFSSISTTLLISPYQNHEKLIQSGENAAKKYGLHFFYADFRQVFKDTHKAIEEYELYKQKYCGCIFSEFDRYKNSRKHKLPVPEN